MTLLNIHIIPDPVLKSIALPVDQIGAQTARLIDDMVQTIRSFPHCVGIAAPQVGKKQRIIVVDASLALRPVANHGLLCLINPRIVRREGSRPGREGCLSIPDFTGNVVRAESIEVEALTPEGVSVSLTSTGFEAVVLQHEIDHLDGILFLDRVASLKTDVFRRKSCIDNPLKKG